MNSRSVRSSIFVGTFLLTLLVSTVPSVVRSNALNKLHLNSHASPALDTLTADGGSPAPILPTKKQQST